MTISPQNGPKVDLREYLRVLLRRFWLLLIPVAVAVMAAFVGSMPQFLRPVYESKSRLMMEFPQPLSQSLQRIVPQTSAEGQFARLASLTQSATFLKKVITRTGLRDDPSAREWALRKASKHPSLTEEELVDLYLMDYLRGTMRAEPGRRRSSNDFYVVVKDYYPKRALDLCSVITNGVVEASNSITQEQVKATHDFAIEQMVLYKQKLEDAERRLQEYRSGVYLEGLQNDLVNARNINQVKSMSTAALVQLEDTRGRRTREMAALQDLGQDSQRWLLMLKPSDVEEATRQYLLLVKGLTRSEIQDLNSGGSNGTTSSLSVQLVNKHHELEDSYLRAVRQEADGISSEVADKVRDLLVADLDMQSARQRHDYIRELIGEHELQAARLPELELEQARLAQEVETMRGFYNTFMEQITAAQIAEAFEIVKVGGRVVILEPPQLPFGPVSPNRPAIMILALVGGLMLGLALVFLVEHHDATVRDVTHLPQELREKVVASLPLIRERLKKEREYRKAGVKGKGVPIFDYYQDETASAFEFRRLVLDLSRSGELPRSIMVTSSERREGKTTTASLLALTIARHRMGRTVLVDMDFRKPSVPRELGLRRKGRGVAEALMDRTIDRETIQPTAEPNLFALLSGSFRGFSPEALTPESVRWLVGELSQWFDYVVIDTPPALAVPDPLVIGRAVDAVLFVVKAGSTTHRVLSRGLELQTRARDNVAGLLVNNIRDVMPYYYSYGHYGYAEEEPAELRKPVKEKSR